MPYAKKPLTEQERKVLAYFAQNYSRQEIVELLSLRYRQVSSTIERCQYKLDVPSAEALRIEARRLGLDKVQGVNA